MEQNMRVLDFSRDNDNLPDNGEYTFAFLNAGTLPESFTICSAFMVNSWNTHYTEAYMFELLDDERDMWGYIMMYAAGSYTEYDVGLGPVFFSKQIETVFFPLQ